MFDRHLIRFAVLLAMAAILLASADAVAIPKMGQPLPVFNVTTPSGQQVGNRNYEGRVLLLVFSTDYCGSCKTAIPDIGRLAGRYGRQDFHVLGLFSCSSMKDDDLMKYMKNYGVAYPMALFEQRLAEEQFGVISVPHSLLIDRKGVVAGIYYGYSERVLKQLEEKIKKLLEE